jgi:hypothetical protein
MMAPLEFLCTFHAMSDGCSMQLSNLIHCTLEYIQYSFHAQIDFNIEMYYSLCLAGIYYGAIQYSSSAFRETLRRPYLGEL